METSISDLYENFYSPEIQNLVFHLPQVQILGTQHYSKGHCEAFEHRGYFHDVMFWRDYEERVVSSFENQIQSEYYGENIFVSIKGVALDQHKTVQQTQIGCE